MSRFLTYLAVLACSNAALAYPETRVYTDSDLSHSFRDDKRSESQRMQAAAQSGAKIIDSPVSYDSGLLGTFTVHICRVCTQCATVHAVCNRAHGRAPWVMFFRFERVEGTG